MTDTAKIRTVKVCDQPEKLAVETKIPMRRHFFSILIGVTLGVLICAAVLVVAILPAARATTKSVAAFSNEIKNLRSAVTALHHKVEMSNTERTIFLKTLVLNPRVRVSMAREVATSVYKNSLLFGRSPDLTLAIIEVESNFNKSAVSDAGARGLMQVMPKWKEILGLKGDLDNIDTNIHHGLQILGFYQETHGGDLDLALAAYNRGPDIVRRDLMNGRDPHHNGYAKRIMDVYNRLRKL